MSILEALVTANTMLLLFILALVINHERRLARIETLIKVVVARSEKRK